MDPDFLHSNGLQGVNMSTFIAHHLPHQAHRQVHPEPHSVLDPLERRTVFSMDLPM